MPIGNITQSVSVIPAPPHRGVDVQTVFVTKQEDFQDHLQGTTVTELNTLKDQLNTRIGEINSTATTMNGYASTASAEASTATTKAGEASTSASGALTSRNQASTSATDASNSATLSSRWAENNYNVAVETGKYSAKHWSVVAQNVVLDTVKLTGNQTVAGVKTFSSSPIVPTPTTNTQAANKEYADLKVALSDFTGANVSLAVNGYQKLPSGLIIQWGLATSGPSGQASLTLPVTFPNAVMQASATYFVNGVFPNICVLYSPGCGSSSVSAIVMNTSGTGVAGAQVKFLVIGY